MINKQKKQIIYIFYEHIDIDYICTYIDIDYICTYNVQLHIMIHTCVLYTNSPFFHCNPFVKRPRLFFFLPFRLYIKYRVHFISHPFLFPWGAPWKLANWFSARAELNLVFIFRNFGSKLCLKESPLRVCPTMWTRRLLDGGLWEMCNHRLAVH